MEEKELKLVVEQIRHIALGSPITSDLECKSEELLEIQSGLKYLSECFIEANDFLSKLAVGSLEINAPKNYCQISSTLKDLQSKLKHLTWQADRVANGNYTQTVSFLGEFSDSFNEMIFQLHSREKALKEKSATLSQSIALLESVMNAIDDSIIVMSVDNGDIIYMNNTARLTLFEDTESKRSCNSQCNLFNYLKTYSSENKGSIFHEHTCSFSKTVLYVTSFTIVWNDKPSYVHYIKDITDQNEYKMQMEKIVYKDHLTDAYNRRFCTEKLQELISNKTEFVCCLVDIDDLKYANDLFGHAAGDVYIKTVVNQIKKVFRSSDYVCRMGGDEFLIITETCEIDLILEKIKKADESLKELSTDYPMAISYGALYVQKDTNFDFKDILEITDEKMYECKNERKKNKNKS